MSDEVLGALSDGPRDDQASLQAGGRTPLLPPNVCVLFRQSGGLRFTALEVTVYLDGRVTWQRTGKFNAGQGARQLKLKKVADLQDLIAQSGFFELPPSIGQPNPDGYAYELIAQIGDQSNAIEFFTGSIPVAVQPLIKRLKQVSADKKR